MYTCTHVGERWKYLFLRRQRGHWVKNVFPCFFTYRKGSLSFLFFRYRDIFRAYIFERKLCRPALQASAIFSLYFFWPRKGQRERFVTNGGRYLYCTILLESYPKQAPSKIYYTPSILAILAYPQAPDLRPQANLVPCLGLWGRGVLIMKHMRDTMTKC